jgi:uncharacterized membrane protein YeaQ/YmgE (transglycosylase-associated protein family)
LGSGAAQHGYLTPMSVIVYLILLAVTGLIVGALARFALPGRDPMSLLQTMLIGLAGSFAAGLVSLLIFDGREGGGILLSVVFASVIVYFIRRSRGGGLMDPGSPRER